MTHTAIMVEFIDNPLPSEPGTKPYGFAFDRSDDEFALDKGDVIVARGALTGGSEEFITSRSLVVDTLDRAKQVAIALAETNGATLVWEESE